MGHSEPVILSILRLAQTWNFAQRGALGRFWAGRWSRDASYASPGPTCTCAQARRSLKPSTWVVRNQRTQLEATAADACESARLTAARCRTVSYICLDHTQAAGPLSSEPHGLGSIVTHLAPLRFPEGPGSAHCTDGAGRSGGGHPMKNPSFRPTWGCYRPGQSRRGP